MYEIIKALHLISIVCWFAGLFYLPRLFVYHVKGSQNSESNEMLKVMEHKLYFYITNPSMICSWVFGSILIHLNPSLIQDNGWLHAKLAFVVGLTIFHVSLYKYLKLFRRDQNAYSEKFYRLINEVPTLLLIVIVFLAVLKPF